MNRDEHITYIKSSLLDIAREVVSTSNHLGNGMEASMVNGYLLQSLFLQMTGAQEQKMKCVCWELATEDLHYRYVRYYKGWTLSQCSTLLDKSHVYEDLLSAIHVKEPAYKIFSNNAEKTTFISSVYNSICSIFGSTNFVRFNKRKYDDFKSVFLSLSPDNITPSNKCLFKNGNKDFPISEARSDTELFAVYSLLYNHRNRCAHNTPSYQLNLPHLKDLRDEKYQKYDNIFVFFAVLVMIDEIFRKLFEKYCSLHVTC